MKYHVAVKNGIVVGYRHGTREYTHAVVRNFALSNGQPRWLATFHPSREHAEEGQQQFYRHSASFPGEIVPAIEVRRPYVIGEQLVSADCLNTESV